MIKVLNSNLELQAYLDDVINPIIPEEINGEYTLRFQTIIDDEKSQYITQDTIFEAEGDYFQVAMLEKERTSNDELFINLDCEHVSYELIEPEHEMDTFTATGTPTDILNSLLSGTGFTVGTVEFSDPITVSIQEKTNRRQILIQIASQLGGELRFNKYEVSLLSRRGSDNGVQFRVGKNLRGIKKTIDKRQKDESGNPSVYYEIDLVELVEHPNYGDLEKIELGDTVRVIDSDLNIDVSTRIVKYSYNPKEKINSSIDLSNVVENLANDLLVIEQQAVKKDRIYNGVKVGPNVGFEAERSDKKARTRMNATEGFKIQQGDGAGNYVDVVFLDTDGNAIFAGKVEGGSIDIGNGTFQVDSNGNLIATSAVVDGEIKTSSSGILLSELFKDTNGGVLKIYDNAGNLNAKIGVEAGTGGNEGGTIVLYNDGENNQRVELGITSDNGRINLRDTYGTVRVSIDADTPSVGVTDSSGSVVSFITPTAGYIDLEKIATETWVNTNYAAKNHTHSSTDGTFTTADGKTVTVTNGIITDIT